MSYFKGFAFIALFLGCINPCANAADYSCQAVADDGSFIVVHFIDVDLKTGTGTALLQARKPLVVTVKENHGLLIFNGHSSTQFSDTEYNWMISAQGAGPYKMIFSVHHGAFDEPQVTGGTKNGTCVVGHK